MSYVCQRYKIGAMKMNWFFGMALLLGFTLFVGCKSDDADEPAATDPTEANRKTLGTSANDILP